MFYHNPAHNTLEDVAAWRKCGNCVGSRDFFGRSFTKTSGSRRLRIPQVQNLPNKIGSAESRGPGRLGRDRQDVTVTSAEGCRKARVVVHFLDVYLDPIGLLSLVHKLALGTRHGTKAAKS